MIGPTWDSGRVHSLRSVLLSTPGKTTWMGGSKELIEASTMGPTSDSLLRSMA